MARIQRIHARIRNPRCDYLQRATISSNVGAVCQHSMRF